MNVITMEWFRLSRPVLECNQFPPHFSKHVLHRQITLQVKLVTPNVEPPNGGLPLRPRKKLACIGHPRTGWLGSLKWAHSKLD